LLPASHSSGNPLAADMPYPTLPFFVFAQ